ncbi:hypothetical protein C6500_20395 [Candidatus Poribacteria bacterium]|nr:MAG: hypothetical protein C6500_20395 [Candidatus Poribacteria bacterium]
MVSSKRDRVVGLHTQLIKNLLTDIRNRMYRQTLFEATTLTFFCGLVLLGILFLLNRVILLPVPVSEISWVVMSIAMIVGVCLSLKYRKDLNFVARAVDEKMGLSERLSTALGLVQHDSRSEFAQLQIQDAVETVTTLDIEKISPYRPPKFLKLFPIPVLLIGLSFAVSPFYEVPQPLTDSQRQALDGAIQNLEEEQVGNSALKRQITDTIKDLKAASDLNTAQKYLSNLKKEVRKQQSVQTAITEATEASQSFRGIDANQLAAELKNLTEQTDIPPKLQAELTELFERLAENLPKGALSDSLNQIQGKTVTAETLQDIIAALEEMEKSTDLAQLEAQLTASQKELALATLEIESPGGGVANSDGAPGRDAGTSEVQGTHEGASNSDPSSESQTAQSRGMESGTDNANSTTPLMGAETPVVQGNREQLTLTAGASGSTEGFSRVFTGEVTDDAPAYLPFADVVLNASRAYAEAVENSRISVRYQTQIKSYLEAVSRKK